MHGIVIRETHDNQYTRIHTISSQLDNKKGNTDLCITLFRSFQN